MLRIELASIGSDSDGFVAPTWGELIPEHPWGSIVELLAPGSVPSDIQVKALREGKLLTSRRNLIISGPTNSGKSLLAYFTMIKGVVQGGRVLMLVPLRAIAQEKFDELKSLMEGMEPQLGRKVTVTITTGDYRLNEESMQSPPSEQGEIVIATPERIEAVWRNPEFDPWISSFQAVCVDEAHLIFDKHRGATLEYVISSFRSLPAPPRIVLLSATLGDLAPLEKWLAPCDSVLSTVRRPPLARTLIRLEKSEDIKTTVIGLVRDILSANEGNSVLIFVYQTSWASSMAGAIQEALGPLCGADGAACYHSRLSSETKARVKNRCQKGTVRCVVSTTALAMGVNLPATHVIVRDLSCGPDQPLSVGALTQMMGRAGRGSRPGHAMVLVKEGETINAGALQTQLEEETFPEVCSMLTHDTRRAGEPALAETVLSLLARRPEEGFTLEEIERFMGHTLNGPETASGCLPALQWLSGQSRLLAFNVEGIWKSTRLGQSAIRSSLPLQVATGTAQLVRDLLSVDESDKTLTGLGPIDVLLLVEMISTKPMLRKTFSENLASLVDDWSSRESAKSALFQQWIRGADGFSKAQELFGSLGIEAKGSGKSGASTARKQGYLAMFRAIVLWQRTHGALSSDLERRWQVKDLDEIQEQWRDDRLFLLGGIRGIWDVRCFFYHLKEDCQAGDERILRVKRVFQRLGVMSFQLINLISWCSPLSSLFIRLRTGRTKGGHANPAQGTMRRLEESGITSVELLRNLSMEELMARGVRKDFAQQIRGFLRRV